MTRKTKSTKLLEAIDLRQRKTQAMVLKIGGFMSMLFFFILATMGWVTVHNALHYNSLEQGIVMLFWMVIVCAILTMGIVLWYWIDSKFGLIG